MAYDKIITVRSRLDHCVDYVLNHEKTDMAAVLDYIGQQKIGRASCRERV